MLVIRRRLGESLLVGDDVEIEILALTQGHVKLGIRAPKSVSILRKEVRVTGEQNREASQTSTLGSITALAKILRKSGQDSSKISSEPR